MCSVLSLTPPSEGRSCDGTRLAMMAPTTSSQPATSHRRGWRSASNIGLLLAWRRGLRGSVADHIGAGRHAEGETRRIERRIALDLAELQAGGLSELVGKLHVFQ